MSEATENHRAFYLLTLVFGWCLWLWSVGFLLILLSFRCSGVLCIYQIDSSNYKNNNSSRFFFQDIVGYYIMVLYNNIIFCILWDKHITPGTLLAYRKFVGVWRVDYARYCNRALYLYHCIYTCCVLLIFDAIEFTRYIGIYSLGVPIENSRNLTEGEQVLNNNRGKSRER